jgi:hypothetical protein
VTGPDYPVNPVRGSLHGVYGKSAAMRDKRARFPRLLDALLIVARRGDPYYLTAPEPGEFSVLDAARQEKGFFELPAGATAHDLRELIEGHFGVHAERVGELAWEV